MITEDNFFDHPNLHFFKKASVFINDNEFSVIKVEESFKQILLGFKFEILDCNEEIFRFNTLDEVNSFLMTYVNKQIPYVK